MKNYKGKSMVTYATAQGPRSYQEDCYYYHCDDLSFLAVMDGHGGKETAVACRQYLELNLSRLLGEFDDPINKLKTVVKNIADRTKHMHAGSTLSMVWINAQQKTAYVAILGDSPVIIINDLITDVSPEHNVRTNQIEQEAAIARGGIYNRGYICNPTSGRGLQLSRALGDSSMGGIVSHEPEVYTVGVQKGCIIIIASDGLFDPSHYKEVQKKQIKEVVALATHGHGAHAILNRAIKRGLQDNTTVLVWRNK